MSKNSGLSIAAGIVAVGALIYALIGEHSTSALLIAAVAGITGVVSFSEFDKKLRSILSQQMTEHDEGAFEDTGKPFTSFDDIWESLQNWYKRDPRNGEIVWKPGVTKFDTTVPKSVDGKFRFVALVTPSKHTDQNIFCCVETNTKSLLTWDEQGEVNRKDMFSSVSLVEDLRKRNHVSAEETHRRIMNNRVAQLGPGGASYAGFMGHTGQKQGDVDVDLNDDGDSGDEE